MVCPRSELIPHLLAPIVLAMEIVAKILGTAQSEQISLNRLPILPPLASKV